jgi:hypothetical protein
MPEKKVRYVKRSGGLTRFFDDSDDDRDDDRANNDDEHDEDDDDDGEDVGYVTRGELVQAVRELDNRNADRFDQLRQDMRERVDDRAAAAAPAATAAPVAGNGHGDTRAVLDRLDDFEANAERARRRGETLSEQDRQGIASAVCDELDSRYVVDEQELESDKGDGKGRNGSKGSSSKSKRVRREDMAPRKLYIDGRPAGDGEGEVRILGF